jgi:hypothetical protein
MGKSPSPSASWPHLVCTIALRLSTVRQSFKIDSTFCAEESLGRRPICESTNALAAVRIAFGLILISVAPASRASIITIITLIAGCSIQTFVHPIPPQTSISEICGLRKSQSHNFRLPVGCSGKYFEAWVAQ